MQFLTKVGSMATSGLYALEALATGPCKDTEAMRSAQHARYNASRNYICSTELSTSQIEARKEYWKAQTFFLYRLLGCNSKEDFKKQLLILCSSINVGNVDNFLDILNKDDAALKKQHTDHSPLDSNKYRPGVTLYEGDVIQLINNLIADDCHIVIDDAPNSQRDGCVKYSRGSVEELLCRYTDAWKMVSHFEDVHARNIRDKVYAFDESKPPTVDVKDHQVRYLKMMLNIISKLVENGGKYLETDQFFIDLLEAQPSKDGVPVYFDMQNNVYEVPISGFEATRAFCHTKQLSLDDIFKKPPSVVPLTVVSYAAPDQRAVAALDKKCTSNKTLQNSGEANVLAEMLIEGINKQCNEAIQLAKANPHRPVSVVIIMPGCGAFGNPEEQTVDLVFGAIQANLARLKDHKITCYVAERNSELVSMMASRCQKGKIFHSMQQENLPKYEKVAFTHQGTNVQLRLQNLDFNNHFQHCSDIVNIFPANLSWKSNSALNSDNHTNSNVIQIQLEKSNASKNQFQELKDSYKSGLAQLIERRDYANITQAHFLLIGTGNMGYTDEQSMQAFLAAVHEVSQTLQQQGKKLPLLVMHIKEDSKASFEVCEKQIPDLSKK